MQFVANGPDIPDALLQAHEDGQVVFFCGAGISYPAGLPGFKGLVDEIYRSIGTTLNPVEEKAYSRDQFDATLNLLEQRFPGQRLTVRSALTKALQPKLRRKGATDTHTALLQLARNREGELRLVTTNFDRIFEKISKRNKQPLNTFIAPMLPIPKNSRWNGLVYLHGLLPEGKGVSADALHRLVLTSGDFGLAYLTERWAARFVSELFRNYVVCFVGYSINDPVLRYMMDALAADRMLGETTPQAYAFGDYQSGDEKAKTLEWEAKGVAPILYNKTATGSGNHSALHHTLKAWAETYRDGILGKEHIVADNAMARPSASTQQDDFVGRMLWALAHESGLPAKRFADFNPVPPIEWLEVFSEERYRHSDLNRFGISPRTEVDDKLHFSLAHRPAPYTHAPWMSLASRGTVDHQWDNVMSHLARWLVRHLNDPVLIIWLARHGGRLHNQWSFLIEHKLDHFARLERNGSEAELKEIRANAPNAIPDSQMCVLWRLLLTGRVKSPWHDTAFYLWMERLKHDGLTTSLRLELRELLTPKVILQEPVIWDDSEKTVDTPKYQKKSVEWELALEIDHIHPSLKTLAESTYWQHALPMLLDDFQQLLRDALDLFRELGEADDRSCLDLPSIAPHWQNRGLRDWIALITLLRDAWLAIRELNPERAIRVAQGWFCLPYLTFKRLALFAASHDDCISSDQWVSWLLDDNSHWLWSVGTKRETMRLLVLQGVHLSPDARARLEAKILIGPPRTMYRDDIKPERWQSLVDRSIWLHLAKLQESGSTLGHTALQRFGELSAKNPEWRLANNDRDEFLNWMSWSGDPDHEENREIDTAPPLKRRDLFFWLKNPSSAQRSFRDNTWHKACRTRFFHSFFALCDLAKEGHWPTKHWDEALQIWSERHLMLRSWRFVAPLIQTMPNEVIHEVVHSLSWWLESVSKVMDQHEAIFLDLCNRILKLPYQDDINTDRPFSRAINHPIGHVSQALLNLCFKLEPNDNDLLPGEIEPLFTRLCNKEVVQYRHGRVLLASHLVALFRVDQHWTEKYLLPFFDWHRHPAEAKAVWKGFLFSPRRCRPLLIAFKTQLLETAHHYAELGECSHHFASFLTYTALDLVSGYSPQDFRSAIEVLPQKGLHEVAQALVQALDGAGDQREEYWKNYIQPFWQQMWPKSRERASNSIAEPLANLSIAAGKEFPSALATILAWLQPIEPPYYVVKRLLESRLAERFPEDSLQLLNAIINRQSRITEELRQCLDALSQATPKLLNDPRYRRLDEYCRRHSM